jgi:nitrite reductase/ring-hydroxylating ferredoxin subunit
MEEVVIFNSKKEMLKVIANREIKRVSINNQQFILVRSGECVFLSEQYCPHMDHNLSEGSVNFEGELICPWHSYRFSLMTGTEAQERCRRLKTFPLTEKDGQMVVRLAYSKKPDN